MLSARGVGAREVAPLGETFRSYGFAFLCASSPAEMLDSLFAGRCRALDGLALGGG
jgi:hypothetical protein